MRKLYLALLALVLSVSAQAAQKVKLSTATTVDLSPLIKIADGSIEASATVANVAVKLMKHSDVSSSTTVDITPAASGSANDMVLRGSVYNLELTASNTDTVGRMKLTATYAGCYPVFMDFEVISTTDWDYLVAGDVATISDFLNEPATTVTDSTSWAGTIQNIDIPVSTVPELTWDVAIPEPTIPLSDSNSAAAVAGWMKIVTYNQITQTNTTKTFHNDADSAVATQTVSDSGTVYTQTKATTP